MSEKWNVGLKAAHFDKKPQTTASREQKRQTQFNRAVDAVRQLTLRLAAMNQRWADGKPISEAERGECRNALEVALAKIDVRALAETAAGNAPFIAKVTEWKTDPNPKAPRSLEDRARQALEELPTSVLQAGLVRDSGEVTLAKATLAVAPGGGRQVLLDHLQKFAPPQLVNPKTDSATIINDILKKRRSNHDA